MADMRTVLIPGAADQITVIHQQPFSRLIRMVRVEERLFHIGA